MESQHSELRGVGSGSVSDRSAIARHEARFFKLVEWSEQLRLVTSVRLGAVRHMVQIQLFTEQRVQETLVWKSPLFYLHITCFAFVSDWLAYATGWSF